MWTATTSARCTRPITRAHDGNTEHARRPSISPMPELPDIALYLHALTPRVVGQRLERLRIASPFVLRSAEPPAADLSGRAVREVRRLGKRIVVGFDGEYFVVLHLMIAGRLQWKPPATPVPRRAG